VSTRNIPLAEATGTVGEVMLREPRVHEAGEDIAVARAEFENPRVRTLLVCAGDRLLGTVDRAQVEAHAGGPATLGELAVDGGPRVAPQDTPARALEVLAEAGESRVPVVDDGGRLVGLVCWNQRNQWFCA
jgi:CBS domain-containing protein